MAKKKKRKKKKTHWKGPLAAELTSSENDSGMKYRAEVRKTQDWDLPAPHKLTNKKMILFLVSGVNMKHFLIARKWFK